MAERSSGSRSSTARLGPRGSGVVGKADEFASRIGDDVFGFRLAEARVDRHGDRAGELDAEKRQTPLEPVAEANGHAIAPLDAEVPQAAGDAGRAVPQLAIRDPLAAGLDNRLGLGRLFDRRAEHGHERGVQTLIVRDAVGAANDSRLIEGADRRHQDLASTELQRISATTHSRLGRGFRRIRDLRAAAYRA